MDVQADAVAKVQRVEEAADAAAADAAAVVQNLKDRVRDLTTEARDARPPTGRDDDDWDGLSGSALKMARKRDVDWLVEQLQPGRGF